MRSSQKLEKRYLKLIVFLLATILVVVIFPVLKSTFESWKTNNERNRAYLKQNKLDKEKGEKLENLLIKHGINYLNLYDDSVAYLQAQERIKISPELGSCESPISPSPEVKKNAGYFDIDFSQFEPSSSKSSYEIFLDDCSLIKNNKSNYQLFTREIGKINHLISQNIESDDLDISSFSKDINEDLVNLKKSSINGYIEVNPTTVPMGGKIVIDYGYLDSTNNEHLNSATTVYTVKIPSGRELKSNKGNVFPNDFSGASTNEKGKYVVEVVRKIMTTYGTEDILLRAINVFYVK